MLLPGHCHTGMVQCGVPSADLSAAAARRIALAAQGFGMPRRAGPVTARHIRKVVDTMGLLQLDSVNVLSRSHYLPVFARLGPYPREILDRLTGHTAGRLQREYVEYWAHEASLVPLATHPLLRWRMARASLESWGRMQRIAKEQPQLLDDIRRLIAEQGPIRSGDVLQERRPKKPGEMWNWHDGKTALEYLFWAGEVGAARRVNFERHYDLIERVLPPHIYNQPTPAKEDAQRELVRIAARAYGVATEPDLGDYFRLPRADSKLRVAELVEAGELVPVTVAGWDSPAYLWPAARRPRRMAARALLSPFDPVVWYRRRTLRLFGFHYRIGIYTPQEQRVHGYYVLPFLLGDGLVARVDLKADRRAGVLRVQATHLEPDAPQATGAELAAELALMARWLGLASVR
ncbi:MAG TPA: crosslink repair DNA glycosylase YcaQ family protein, partial [Jatrophihabitans sp.]